jgi:hypothetical protein
MQTCIDPLAELQIDVKEKKIWCAQFAIRGRIYSSYFY